MRFVITVFLVAVFSAAVGLAQAPQIVSVTPLQYELDAPVSANISVTFDTDMDESSINDSTFLVNAKSTGIHRGEITYDFNTRTATLNPFDDFDIAEEITVALTTGIQSDNQDPLLTGYVWSFTVAVNDGTGGLTSDSEYNIENNAGCIILADIDNDTDNDIVCTEILGNSVLVLLNDGNGMFTFHNDYSVGIAPAQVFASELDGDGYIDLVITNADSDNISVLLNDGHRGFAPHVTYAVGDYPTGLFVAELNGDGHNDIAVVNFYDDNVSILFNDGNGTFNILQRTYDVGNQPRFVVAADIDNDGDLDLVNSNYIGQNLRILINEGNSEFSEGPLYSVPDPIRVCAADLNEDGYVDLMATNYQDGGISILLNNGNGTFGDQSLYYVCSHLWDISTGDFDNDNDLDIITGGYDGHMYMLLNNGDGTFGSPEFQIHSRILFPADINGDGALDVATTNPYQHKIYVLLNESVTHVGPETRGVPNKSSLDQNYPNPFNAKTTILFSVAESGKTSLRVYDIAGRIVKTLLNDKLDTGQYNIIWDGTDNRNEPVVSGVYFYTLEKGYEKTAIRMLLLK